ncbi:D-alanyl-D-alanine carboxypeptidase family protein [Paraliobacillus ryukyuensis]|uniref:D-alanyl-D-alanine carboxypeptidase family protein n=1 Tax=Paraliobacillus ryukyuensis TaxID=200904 RepID=UPI0009A68B4C|nr:D-alanyl-D-alanine carboxypeptidase family protein [Paraliobacillus ryukyuensis]
MKRRIKTSVYFVFAFVIFLTSIGFSPLQVAAADLDLKAESAILIDGETGQILFAKNADIKLPPASMTKMMTEYLTMEAIKNETITWETETGISNYAYRISGDSSSSGIGLRQDKQYTVKDLYEAMAINSDNAASIALAELIAGSEGEFVKMMNQKAEELGMKEYEFVNTTGLSNSDLGEDHPAGTDPNADNLLSARAAALLAYHLVNDYPESLEYSSQLTDELDGRTTQNWNWMLPWNNDNFAQYYYEGIDGLKTGHTDAAGYTFTGTAERDGRRLISVVMKTDSIGARFEQTKKLMDYGFNQFSKQELYPAGYQIEDESTLNVSKGKEDTVEVESKNAITATVKNGEEEAYSVNYRLNEDLLDEDGNLIAPVEKGQVVGTMELIYTGSEANGYITGDGQTQSVDLVATTAVEKSNWFMLALGAIGDFFGNIFTSVKDTVVGWFS